MDYQKNEAVLLTQKLVQIESTNVGTYEGEVSKFVESWLKEQTKVEVVRDEFEPGRFNVIATLKGKVAHPNLIYIAHMDTVPIGSGWTKDPLGGQVEDGKLYGRGALDMKCGLAAAMIAFRDMEHYCRENKITPKFDFVFIASGDEEDVMKGADKIVEMGIAAKDSLVLDTEPADSLCAAAAGSYDPSVSSIIMAHKGKSWFEIFAQGKAAHGSLPYLGVDAIVAMSEIVLEIKNRLAALPVDPVLGPSSVCFGTIKGGNNTNIVADQCAITIDMRLSPPLTTEGSFKLVEDAIAAGTARVPGSSGSYRVIAYRPFVSQDENSVLFQALKKSVKKIADKEAKLAFFAGYTDSGVIAGSTGSGNCMSYGANGLNFHQGDEYVECDSLIETTNVVCDLARRLLLDEE